MARRIGYLMISGNAYVDKASKPNSEEDLWGLTVDGEKKKTPRKKKLTKKDIDIFKQMIHESLELNSKGQG